MNAVTAVVSRLRRWRSLGIRTRVVATTAALSLVGMALLVVLTDLALEWSINASVAGLLSERATAVANADPDSRSTFAGTSSEFTTWLFDADGVLTDGSQGQAVDQAAAQASRAAAGTTREVDEWLLLTDELPSGQGTVVVATSLEPYETARHLALIVSAALGVLVVVAISVVTGVTVRRALNPVRSMARSASLWSENDLDRRFDLGPVNDEITELGSVLNRLLGRVAQVLRAEQRLTAELAHELRTPLTVIRAEAELGAASASIGEDDRNRLTRIVTATEHMHSVIDSLMSAARGSVADDVRTDVDGVLAAATRSPSLPEGPSVVVQAAAMMAISVPPEIAQRALSPLLSNAMRYGDRRVSVSAQRIGAFIAIDVEDDGPGVLDGQDDAVFEPGQCAADSPGAGLGLPLARRIARACGGDVRLVSSRPARFRLTLPAA